MKIRSEARTMYGLLQTEKKLKADAVLSYVQSLSTEEKIAQLFLVNLEGKSVFRPVEHTPDGKPLIPGGYLFFSYNIADSVAAIRQFTDNIASYCKSRNIIPPLLTLDQEGGTVNRLRSVSSPLPSAALIAQRMPVHAAEELYGAQAQQLTALGFHINLAPVAETADDSNMQFLGTRSFGTKDSVLTYVPAAVRGYERNGVGTVLKHFPGNTNDDPHTGLPEILLSAEELEAQYIDTFRTLLLYEPTGVLMSHVRTAAYDSKTPACLSSFWVTSVLRKELEYEGLVFSDDIFMAALERNGFPPADAVVMAVEAGIDVIMLSEKKFASSVEILAQKAATGTRFAAQIDAAVIRILNAKIRAGILNLEHSGGAYALHIADAIPSADFESAFKEGTRLYALYFGGKK